MQNIFIEKPYAFVPPKRGTFLASFFRDLQIFRYALRKREGVISYECKNFERLRKSIDAGHGVIVTPNHPRTADPVATGFLTYHARCNFYVMASWHLFNQSWFDTWAMRTMGAFSVYREGLDRQALTMGIDVIANNERPLLIFPEGTATRVNDRLQEMLDGISFIAQSAAKKREKEGKGPVVVHPVSFRYIFKGDIRKAVEPVLDQIERRLTFRPLADRPLLERLERIGHALLSLKEIEYFGDPQPGTFSERQTRLVNRLMHPLETEWLGGPREGGIVGRVKDVRMKVFPDVARGEVSSEERDRRFKQLADTYLAQQVAMYPENYVREKPTVERILETVERFEEDMTDECRVHGHLHVIIDVLEPIEVSGKREKGAASDPIMDHIRNSIQKSLEETSVLTTPYQD